MGTLDTHTHTDMLNTHAAAKLQKSIFVEVFAWAAVDISALLFKEYHIVMHFKYKKEKKNKWFIIALNGRWGNPNIRCREAVRQTFASLFISP